MYSYVIIKNDFFQRFVVRRRNGLSVYENVYWHRKDGEKQSINKKHYAHLYTRPFFTANIANVENTI